MGREAGCVGLPALWTYNHRAVILGGMDIADRLRRTRQNAELTQAELAALIGTRQPLIAAYETGAKRPSADMVIRLLDTMNILPSAALDLHRTEVRTALTRRFGQAAQPRTFGSVARRSDTLTSDLDILIVAPETTTLVDLELAEDEIEAIVGVDTDIITVGGLDPIRHAAVLADSIPL